MRWNLRSGRRAGLRRLGTALAAGLGAMLAAAAAQAVSLSLVAVPPTPDPIQSGDTVLVEIRIAGLGDGTDPSLTAFSLDITFTESVLDFVAFTYGPMLGTNTTNSVGAPCTLANLDATCDVLLKNPATVATPGKVSPEATSLFAPGDLDANQPAAGVLGTIEFLVHATANAALAFQDADLAGTLGGGSEGPLAATRSGLLLQAPPPPVPEPGPGALLALAGAGLAWRRRR